jgi:acetyl esterase
VPSADEIVVGIVTALPAFVQRLLAGGRAVRVDGLELEPDIQLLLALRRLRGDRDLSTMTPAEARVEIARGAASFAGTLLPVARVESLTLPGAAGPIGARLYVPDGKVRGLLVYYHGGGWVVGDLDTHEAPCRFLAREAGIAVLSVDYRRAPEHRFPAAVEDSLAAFRWASAETDRLGVPPGRVAVGGDSAGGNRAAVVTLLATREGGPVPRAQLLIYPVTDLSKKHPSYQLFAEGFFLSARDMDWYRSQYLPDASAALDPRASPLLAPDLHGLPPAIVLTAGFDVLRDEGEAYARRLADAGVVVTHRRVPGQIHGFGNATGISSSARTAMGEAARTLAETLQA